MSAWIAGVLRATFHTRAVTSPVESTSNWLLCHAAEFGDADPASATNTPGPDALNHISTVTVSLLNWLRRFGVAT